MSTNESREPLEWECPCCGRWGPSDYLACFNTHNSQGVIIHTTEGRSGNACFDRFDAAVGRLWDLNLNIHFFKMPGDDDLAVLSIISCTEFEQYVDDLANGEDASWFEEDTDAIRILTELEAVLEGLPGDLPGFESDY